MIGSLKKVSFIDFYLVRFTYLRLDTGGESNPRCFEFSQPTVLKDFEQFPSSWYSVTAFKTSAFGIFLDNLIKKYKHEIFITQEITNYKFQ